MPPMTSPPTTPDPETANVLLVDDDGFILRLLTAVFRRKGIVAVTAETGAEALGILQRLRPELIIADVKMPGMTGYELCRRVRGMGLDVPFIFCSSLDGQRERVLGLKVGADDYIGKPVNTEELVLKATVHLERIRKLRAVEQRMQRADADVLNGQLGPLSVSDVLQLAALLRPGPVIVRLQNPDRGLAEVVLEGPELRFVQAGTLTGERAFLQIVQWEKGTFQMAQEPWSGPRNTKALLDEALLNSLAAADESRMLHESLAGPWLSAAGSPALLGRRLEPSQAQVMALVEVHGHLDTVLDHSPLPMADTIRVLRTLLDDGRVVASATP